jgi:hypothetical protein
MQKWEYNRVVAYRNTRLFGMGKWEGTPDLAAFGEEGWELISVCPVSSPGGMGLAGVTSEMVYVFKRPKE